MMAMTKADFAKFKVMLNKADYGSFIGMLELMKDKAIDIAVDMEPAWDDTTLWDDLADQLEDLVENLPDAN